MTTTVYKVTNGFSNVFVYFISYEDAVAFVGNRGDDPVPVEWDSDIIDYALCMGYLH